MKTNISSKGLFVLTILAILIGLSLTLLSLLGTCTEACMEGNKYRLFGLPFAWVGLFYFLILLGFQLYSRAHSKSRLYANLLLAIGTGAEIIFILIQKLNGSWCPLCLGIATSIFIATVTSQAIFAHELIFIVKQEKSGDILKILKMPVLMAFTVLLGLFSATFGISKIEENLNQQFALEHEIAIGNTNSPIEIFVFTSWTCPACKKFEPTLQRMIPDLLNSAKVTFVDFGEDMTTLNFLPFNLSFLLYNKSDYVSLRKRLKEIAAATKSPSESQIEEIAKELGIKYEQLNYSIVATAVELFKDLVSDFKIKAIPALVVRNTITNKQEMFVGLQITRLNVLAAIEKKTSS